MAWISKQEAKERGLLKHSETRRVDPAPPPAKVPGVPPHKLPRTYCLEIVTTTTTIRRKVHCFITKRQRDDFRLAQQKQDKRPKPWDKWERHNESELTERTVDYRDFMGTATASAGSET